MISGARNPTATPGPARLGILVFALLMTLTPASARWTNQSGNEIAGEPVAFDFARKSFTFLDPVTKEERPVPVAELSLHSRQLMLIEPVFLRSQAGDEGWTPEKRRLLLLALGAFAACFTLALWGSAFVVLKKWNPVLAFVGFLGTWIVLGILIGCYLFLHHRYGHDHRVLYVGAAVILGVTPLYLSSVYGCSYGKSHLLLILHLVAGLVLMGVALFASELILGTEGSTAWWDREVFGPVGLIASDPVPRTTP